MRERLGALVEFKTWASSLDLSYHKLLEEYGQFEPAPGAASGERRR